MLNPHSYNPVVDEAGASSHCSVRLGDYYVVFYTTQGTNELRVRAHGSQQVFTLATDMKYVHGFVLNDVAHMYAVSTNGEVTLFRYKHFGDPAPRVDPVTLGNAAAFVHVRYQDGWYLLTSDDGGTLFLLIASDPRFLISTRRVRLYANALTPGFYVNKPTLGIHPEDYHPAPAMTRITVGVEQLELATGNREVGFFVTETTLEA
jgi:hypothetical protein